MAAATPPRAGPGRRGRPRGAPAAAAVALAVLAATTTAVLVADDPDRSRSGTELAVRDATGQVLASVPLPGGEFAMSYRNSLYGTLAEERYAVAADRQFRVVELAADQLAVLEEYYAVPGAPRQAAENDRRAWTADPDPDRPAVFTELRVSATDLGRRTLHVPGTPPLALWRLVGDDPTVVLRIEEMP